MSDLNLFTPYTLGALTLSNRVVLAPLTRNRAGKGFVPSEFAAAYYSQRASAGLLISEASQISQQGQGYHCLLYTSPSPRDLSTSRMPSSA